MNLQPGERGPWTLDVGHWTLVAVILFGLITSGIAAGMQRKATARVKVDELFNRNCARCHGADGRGDTPSGHLFKSPDFTDSQWWQKNATSPTALRGVVVRGKGSMPAFGKKLTRTEINLLVDRIRKFRKPERQR